MAQIILIEDDAGIREVVHAILERDNFDVRDAGTCVEPEAEHECHLFCCEGTNAPDVVMVAIIGQRCCSGVHVALKALQKWPKVKVLLTSASPVDMWPPSAKVLLRSLPTDSYSFLPKPFTTSQLRTAVQGLLARYYEAPTPSLLHGRVSYRATDSPP